MKIPTKPDNQPAIRKKLIKRLDIAHELDVFDARRGLLERALTLGFRSDQSHCLVTALTELANNIVVHSFGGWISIEQVWRPRENCTDFAMTGIALTAVDHGPGIPDIGLALKDGFSTIDSVGCGLPGVKRLMHELVLESSTEGTRISAIMWTKDPV